MLNIFLSKLTICQLRRPLLNIKTFILTFSASTMFFSCWGMENKDVPSSHENSLKRVREPSPEDPNGSGKRHKNENSGVENTPETTLFHCTLSAAHKGDPMAQCNLGYMYGTGQGVLQNYEKAIEWYQKAAAQGNLNAQQNLQAVFYALSNDLTILRRDYCLGILYEKGWGTATNYVMAAKHYLVAAQQGISEAQAQLGSMFATGAGLVLNLEQAIYWFKQAAQQGNMVAQKNLGRAYALGSGVQKDLSQAIRWFGMVAQKNYECVEKNFQTVFKNLSEDRTIPHRYYCLGRLYEKGWGVQKDPEMALIYYQHAVQKMDLKAQYQLGVIWAQGTIVQKNMNTAFQYFHQAALQGDPKAQFQVGRMFAEGQGVTKDLAEAFQYFQQAAKAGIPAAQYKLGCMYAEGTGTPQDLSSAIKWLESAAWQGYISAQQYIWNHFVKLPCDQVTPERHYYLGLSYEKGWGTPPNIDTALMFYLQAAHQGSGAANFRAATLYRRQGDEMGINRTIEYYQMAIKQGHLEAAKDIMTIANGDIHTLPGEILAVILREVRGGTQVGYNNFSLVCQQFREIRNKAITSFDTKKIVQATRLGEQHINFINEFKNLQTLYWYSDWAEPKQSIEALAKITPRGLSVIMDFQRIDASSSLTDEVDALQKLLKTNKNISSLEIKGIEYLSNSNNSSKETTFYLGSKICEGLKKNTTLTSLKLPIALTKDPFPIVKKLLQESLSLKSLDFSYKEMMRPTLFRREDTPTQKIVILAIKLSSFLKKVKKTTIKEIDIGIEFISRDLTREFYNFEGISDEEWAAYQVALQSFKDQKIMIK